jgi:two-component system response regulator NreC
MRLLLADDHAMVRQGLRKLLESRPGWQVVAEAGDGREAVRLAEEHRPDVAIVDVSMPLINGMEVTRQITTRSPSTRVLVVSMYSDDAYVTQILRSGATGYILKESADTDLMEAVTVVARGRTTKDIATLLSISASTVDTHRGHIMEKLDMHSAAEIVLYAARRGLVR